MKVSFLRSSLGEYFLAQRLRISMIQMADIGVRDCLKGASTFIIRDHLQERVVGQFLFIQVDVVEVDIHEVQQFAFRLVDLEVEHCSSLVCLLGGIVVS